MSAQPVEPVQSSLMPIALLPSGTRASGSQSAFDRIVEALEHYGCAPRPSGRGVESRCPAHDDSRPSLSIARNDQQDGVVFRCHAGCQVEDVVQSLGLALRDLYDEPRNPRQAPRSTVVSEYEYTDEGGELLYIVERHDPKAFRQRRPDGQGGWVWKLGDVRRVLYRLPEVQRAVVQGQTVYVPEGEKDVERLRAAGHVGTCNPGGAGKWRPEYADLLAGADVVVVADRDAPGRQHAVAVAASLEKVGATVRLLEPASGKDVSEHLDAGRGLDELVPLADVPATSTPPAAPDNVDQYPILDWHEVFSRARTEPQYLCKPLVEVGRVTALYSSAKVGKSLIVLEIAAGIATGRPVLGNPARPSTRVLYVDLENSEEDIRERLADMGYGPDDLGDLRYLSFPNLPALDSPKGGADLLAVAQLHAAQLVVIDTVSRVVVGEEISSDTFRALYRHAMMPLKASGITVLRLDHAGKDVQKGQRGSSGKNDDVDAVWALSRSKADGAFDLTRTHSRNNHGADHLVVVRRTAPLRHEVVAAVAAASGAEGLVTKLDALAVPVQAGRDVARAALAKAGIKVANAPLSEALRVRKARDGQSGTGPGPTPREQ